MSPYTPPPIVLGQMIYWYADGDRNSQPQPAIVTKAGSRALTIGVFVPGWPNMQVVDGVHHAGDPVLKERINTGGAWDYHDIDKAIKQQLDDLRKLIDELTGGKTEKADKKKVA